MLIPQDEVEGAKLHHARSKAKSKPMRPQRPSMMGNLVRIGGPSSDELAASDIDAASGEEEAEEEEAEEENDDEGADEEQQEGEDQSEEHPCSDIEEVQNSDFRSQSVEREERGDVEAPWHVQLSLDEPSLSSPEASMGDSTPPPGAMLRKAMRRRAGLGLEEHNEAAQPDHDVVPKNFKRRRRRTREGGREQGDREEHRRHQPRRRHRSPPDEVLASEACEPEAAPPEPSQMTGLTQGTNGSATEDENQLLPATIEFLRGLVTEIYATANPTKIAEVDILFSKYAGMEFAMYERICEKYGRPAETLANIKARQQSERHVHQMRVVNANGDFTCAAAHPASASPGF